MLLTVGRLENPGVQVLFVGHNPPFLVDIGLSDLPCFGDANPGDDRSDDWIVTTLKEIKRMIFFDGLYWIQFRTCQTIEIS